MSYASVAASNTPYPQPKPDPALLTTPQSQPNVVDDDNAKVKVVPNPANNAQPSRRHDRVRDEKGHDDDNSFHLWQLTKRHLFRPGVAGGLIGLGKSSPKHASLFHRLISDPIVNVGLLAGVARSFYLQPELRRNPRVVSATVGAALALLTAEGYAAEQYGNTPAGRHEARRAKQEGTLLYRHFREQILRPGVLGGLVGLGLLFLAMDWHVHSTSSSSQHGRPRCSWILLLHLLG